jgi:hypothetical protein
MPHPATAALALLLLAGCTVEREVASPPAYAPAYVAAPTGKPVDGSGAEYAPAPAYGAAAVDPYCREAMAEARAAGRDARMAAREARLGYQAGAPGWAQDQDQSRAATAAAQADRTRAYAARDC